MKKEIKKTDQTDLQKEGLKGAVIKMKQISYVARVKKTGYIDCVYGGNQFPRGNKIMLFNRQGNKTMEQWYYGGEGEYSQKQIFNEKGLAVETTHYNGRDEFPSISKMKVVIFLSFSL